MTPNNGAEPMNVFLNPQSKNLMNSPILSVGLGFLCRGERTSVLSIAPENQAARCENQVHYLGHLLSAVRLTSVALSQSGLWVRLRNPNQV
ncbi:MAG: hypothetical protein HUJ13_00325 [Hydrogenovibrio crunogenus]|nr:hypothetical protein [Hydrogenovibrio crunogenus]